MTTVESLPAAGRDLDALVAERVMGWPRSNRDYSQLAWNVPTGIRTWEPSSFGSGFRPSTEIAAAWEVVEKLEGGGPRKTYWWSIETKGWAQFPHKRQDF